MEGWAGSSTDVLDAYHAKRGGLKLISFRAQPAAQLEAAGARRAAEPVLTHQPALELRRAAY